MPSLDRDPPKKHQPGGPMRRGDVCFLARQQAGEDGDPARREVAGEVRRHAGQRAREDVGKDKVVRRSGADARTPVAVARAARYQRRHAVEPRVLARHLDRMGIDIAGQHLHVPRLGGRDGEDAGAGPHVEDAAPSTTPGEKAERAEAAFRRGMLAGAEGGGGVDQQRDRPGRRRVLDMAAMDEVAADAQRREALLVALQPVDLLLRLEVEGRLGNVERTGGERQPGLDASAVRLALDIALDEPGPPRRRLEGGDGVGDEADQLRDRVRGALVGHGHADPPQPFGHPRSLVTKASITFFSPACSKSMVSLLSSTSRTVPPPNFWWNTRSPGANPPILRRMAPSTGAAVTSITRPVPQGLPRLNPAYPTGSTSKSPAPRPVGARAPWSPVSVEASSAACGSSSTKRDGSALCQLPWIRRFAA